MTRHVLGGFDGLMPHPPRAKKRARVPGLRHGGKGLQFCCRILGQDIWLVDGQKLRQIDPDFTGVALHTLEDYVPASEIWIDSCIPGWKGYVTAGAVLAAILMQVRHWGEERAIQASMNLEQWLREVAHAHGGNNLPREMPVVWRAVIHEYLPGLEPDQVDEMAQQASRQLWKYL